jgi:hypothetical protein
LKASCFCHFGSALELLFCIGWEWPIKEMSTLLGEKIHYSRAFIQHWYIEIFCKREKQSSSSLTFCFVTMMMRS